MTVSDAIEGADVMLYGVSLAYKESANCRLEANYAHQQAKKSLILGGGSLIGFALKGNPTARR